MDASATGWWERVRPSVAVRRGPLSVLIWAAAVWLAHRIVRQSGWQMGAVASGLLTLALMLAAATYAARRRLVLLSLYLVRPFSVVPALQRFRRWAVRADELRSWRLAHLAIGTACVLPLWWHMEATNGGVLETVLFGVVIVLLGSGVLGVSLQYAMPQSMLHSIEHEVRVRDVEQKRRAIFVEAEERILGRSEALVDAYVRSVRPTLQGDPPRLQLLEATLRRQDPGALVRGRHWRLLEQLDEKDSVTFRELLDLAERKARLDLNLFHLDLSTHWLSFHSALVVLTGTLAFVHIAAVLYFGGL